MFIEAMITAGEVESASPVLPPPSAPATVAKPDARRKKGGCPTRDNPLLVGSQRLLFAQGGSLQRHQASGANPQTWRHYRHSVLSGLPSWGRAELVGPRAAARPG